MNLSYLLSTLMIGSAGIFVFQDLGSAAREVTTGSTEAAVANKAIPGNPPSLGSSSQAAGIGWARHFGKLPEAVQKAARLEMDVLNDVVDLERAQALAAKTDDQARALQRAQAELGDFENLVEAAGASYLTRDPSPLRDLELRLASWMTNDVGARFQELLAQSTVLNGELPIVRTRRGPPRVTIDPRQGGSVRITGITKEMDADMLQRVRTFYSAFRAEIDDFGVQLEVAFPGDNYSELDRVLVNLNLLSAKDEPFRVWVGPEVDVADAETWARNVRSALVESLDDPAIQKALVSYAMSDFEAETRALLGRDGNVREARLNAIRRMMLQSDSPTRSGHPKLRFFDHVFPDHQVRFLGEAGQGKAGPLYARFTRELLSGKTRDVLEIRGDISSPGSLSPEHLVDAADLYREYGAALLDRGVELHVTMSRGADEVLEGDYQGARFVDIGIEHESPRAALKAVLDRANGID